MEVLCSFGYNALFNVTTTQSVIFLTIAFVRLFVLWGIGLKDVIRISSIMWAYMVTCGLLIFSWHIIAVLVCDVRILLGCSKGVIYVLMMYRISFE